MEALDWLSENHDPELALHAEIGGDGLLTGFERNLGSYKTDTLARAALLMATESHGWGSYIAVG